MLAVLIAGAILFVQNKGGEIFVEDTGNELEKLDIIRINTPRPNQPVSSPLVIEGGRGEHGFLRRLSRLKFWTKTATS